MDEKWDKIRTYLVLMMMKEEEEEEEEQKIEGKMGEDGGYVWLIL